MPGPFRQHVPRPADAVVVGPPRFAGAPLLPGALDAFVASLPPPGAEDASLAGEVARADAAVLALCYDSDGGPAVIVIRRAGSLSSDPGDIAFPGGRIEPGESPAVAAVREAEEEVSLDASDLGPLRLLGVFGRFSRHVALYIALLARPPRLVPHAGEVDAILEARLAELVDPRSCWEECWDGRAMYFFAAPLRPFAQPGAAPSPLRDCAGAAPAVQAPPPSSPSGRLASPAVQEADLVWGLTAWMLWDLVARLVVSSRLVAGAGEPSQAGR